MSSPPSSCVSLPPTSDEGTSKTGISSPGGGGVSGSLTVHCVSTLATFAGGVRTGGSSSSRSMVARFSDCDASTSYDVPSRRVSKLGAAIQPQMAAEFKGVNGSWEYGEQGMGNE
eukprot:5248700-Alexandrium_andersonii.AAC.1